jgi:hypothetical protein
MAFVLTKPITSGITGNTETNINLTNLADVDVINGALIDGFSLVYSNSLGKYKRRRIRAWCLISKRGSTV